jgi:hypothetical protein
MFSLLGEGGGGSLPRVLGLPFLGGVDVFIHVWIC